MYALSSQLGAHEVLAPDAKKRFCGMFKGELVYRRSDVSAAMMAKKWLYQGRKVRDEEMGKPAKRVKARKKAAPKGFKQLKTYGVGPTNDGSEEAQQREIAKASIPEIEEDGKVDLYGFWQTQPWAPDPVGPDDEIPTNEYNNVELALINPGLVHLDTPRMALVAKQLGV
jgi:xeroderma pigmentosum group C-complementing protein